MGLACVPLGARHLCLWNDENASPEIFFFACVLKLFVWTFNAGDSFWGGIYRVCEGVCRVKIGHENWCGPIERWGWAGIADFDLVLGHSNGMRLWVYWSLYDGYGSLLLELEMVTLVRLNSIQSYVWLSFLELLCRIILITYFWKWENLLVFIFY